MHIYPQYTIPNQTTIMKNGNKGDLPIYQSKYHMGNIIKQKSSQMTSDVLEGNVSMQMRMTQQLAMTERVSLTSFHSHFLKGEGLSA